jgi:hypothetical protein
MFWGHYGVLRRADAYGKLSFQNVECAHPAPGFARSVGFGFQLLLTSQTVNNKK